MKAWARQAGWCNAKPPQNTLIYGQNTAPIYLRRKEISHNSKTNTGTTEVSWLEKTQKYSPTDSWTAVSLHTGQMLKTPTLVLLYKKNIWQDMDDPSAAGFQLSSL